MYSKVLDYILKKHFAFRNRFARQSFRRGLSFLNHSSSFIYPLFLKMLKKWHPPSKSTK